mgnify:CR=1 FL=1
MMRQSNQTRSYCYITDAMIGFLKVISAGKIGNIYNGKLVKKGICMNYVIQVNNKDFPKELIEEFWIDDFTSKEFSNVFALESVCDFPTNIDEGQSFKFIIDQKKDNFCAVCKAYSPVPSKYLSITVIDK